MTSPNRRSVATASSARQEKFRTRPANVVEKRPSPTILVSDDFDQSGSVERTDGFFGGNSSFSLDFTISDKGKHKDSSFLFEQDDHQTSLHPTQHSFLLEPAEHKDSSFLLEPGQHKDSSFQVVHKKDSSFQSAQDKESSFQAGQNKDSSFSFHPEHQTSFQAGQNKDSSFRQAHKKNSSFQVQQNSFQNSFEQMSRRGPLAEASFASSIISDHSQSSSSTANRQSRRAPQASQQRVVIHGLKEQEKV
jgi:hypothetical protein